MLHDVSALFSQQLQVPFTNMTKQLNPLYISQRNQQGPPRPAAMDHQRSPPPPAAMDPFMDGVMGMLMEGVTANDMDKVRHLGVLHHMSIIHTEHYGIPF